MTEPYLKLPPDMLTDEQAKPPTFGAIAQRAGFDPGSLLGYGGHEWIERVVAWPAWNILASWGRDGWDLGAWDLVAVAHGVSQTDEGKRYHLAQRVEGDITVWDFDDPGALMSATDRLAAYWWRLDPEAYGAEMVEAVKTTDRHDHLPPRFRGPFSRKRLALEAS